MHVRDGRLPVNVQNFPGSSLACRVLLPMAAMLEGIFTTLTGSHRHPVEADGTKILPRIYETPAQDVDLRPYHAVNHLIRSERGALIDAGPPPPNHGLKG